MTFRQRYRWQAFMRMHTQAKSALALLCLAFSLAALMLVLALQAGTRAQMASIMEDTGSRNLTVTAGTVRALPNRGAGLSGATSLSPQDYAALRLQAQQRSQRAAALRSAMRMVEYRELAMGANVIGTEPLYFALQHFQLAQGRLFDALDDTLSANVAVLGAEVAEQLFGSGQERVLAPAASIGQHIRVAGVPFEVIGVLQARGSGVTGMSQDDGVYLPLSTAMHQVFDTDYLNGIVLEAAGLAVIPGLRDQLTALLRQRHGVPETEEADFTLLDASNALAASQRNQAFAASFFRGLAVLMLTLSGAGLFAVNHLGVKARGHEFGLRRAVGATRANILTLVLGETLLLGSGGGILGLLLGYGVFAALTLWTAWALRVDGWIIVQVALAALMMSVVASLLPALQAALRNPVQALNQE
jgi:putative ABC transport system permease protein